MKKPFGRILELDGLRGLACLFVMVHHYFTGIAAPHFQGALSVYFWKIASVFLLSGVDLFYVLSGFLVGGIIIENYDKSSFLKAFFVRRACRILPLYFTLILSYSLGPALLERLGLLGPWADEWLLDRPLPFWSYLTFLQSYVMGILGHSGPKWVAITWSVSVEEQFYLLMPFIFFFLGCSRAMAVTCTGILVSPVIRAYFFDNFGTYAGYTFFPGRMDSLFWGVLLAFLFCFSFLKLGIHSRTKIMLSLGVISFALIMASQSLIIKTPRYAIYTFLSIFYFVMIWAVLEKKSPALNNLLSTRFLIFTGKISYACYMFHQLVNGLMHGLIFGTKPFLNHWSQWLVTLPSMALLYLLSYFSHRYYEKPFLSYGKKFEYNAQKKSV
jgi:peptidoglycan/LPS O-acetylase OafA/YrhL